MIEIRIKYICISTEITLLSARKYLISVSVFSCRIETELSAPVLLNGDYLVNLEELKTCRDVPVCIDYLVYTNETETQLNHVFRLPSVLAPTYTCVARQLNLLRLF